MPPILQIQLLGTFSLLHDGKPVTSVNGSRLQTLLAYLVLHSDLPQLRQKLAFQFWPETTDTQAQTNLRQLLHTLRHKLPDADHFVEITPSTLRWRADAPFQLDVAEFQSALAQAQQVHLSEPLANLARAVDFYTGDLLPGCYDDWVVLERERLAQEFLAALERLIAALAEKREYGSAIQYAQRLLRHDPLHEAAYYKLMQIYAATNDRAGALRVYHTCAALLARELGVEPSAPTRELYEQLLHAEHTAMPVTQVQSGIPFVGRHHEWQALQQIWNSTKQGGRHFVCLTGEAGIGKTRLAEELIRWAQSQGIAAIHTRAYGAEGELAYAPLAEALRSEMMSTLMTRLEPVWLTELARICPELIASRPDLPRPEAINEPPANKPWQRQRLFEALARAFLAARRPLIVVIDDLQWCDRETMEWLHYFLRYEQHTPLLVIGSLRPEELMPDDPVAQSLLSLRASHVAYTELHLERLNREQTSELVAGVVNRSLTRAVLDHLYWATEGNPLFVVEIVRSNLETFTLNIGITESDSATLSFDILPPKVRAILRARLVQVSAPARDIVCLAAVLGRSFTFDLLAAASAQNEDTLVRALDELWQRHIVRAQGVNGYDFSHDRLREVAYAELTPARRRLLHKQVAQALETVFASDLDSVSAQLAHHYEQVGAVKQAIHYLQRAADVGRRRYAHREAVTYLENAIRLLRTLPANDMNPSKSWTYKWRSVTTGQPLRTT